MNVQTEVTVEHRLRSIYQAQMLNTKAVLNATFTPSEMLLPKNTVLGWRVQCDAPILKLALDDPRGLHLQLPANALDAAAQKGRALSCKLNLCVRSSWAVCRWARRPQ